MERTDCCKDYDSHYLGLCACYLKLRDLYVLLITSLSVRVCSLQNIGKEGPVTFNVYLECSSYTIQMGYIGYIGCYGF